MHSKLRDTALVATKVHNHYNALNTKLSFNAIRNVHQYSHIKPYHTTINAHLSPFRKPSTKILISITFVPHFFTSNHTHTHTHNILHNYQKTTKQHKRLHDIKATTLTHPELPPNGFTLPIANPQANPYK